jgi:hypothetical protein
MQDLPDIDIGYHRRLFQITDKLNRAAIDPRNLTAEEFTAILREVCGALRKSINADIEQIFRTAAGLTNRPELHIEALAVVKDTATFTKFIEFEKQALRDCGVGHSVADHISNNVFKLREQLSQTKIDPEKTMAVLKRFQDDVCTAADHANADLDAKERRHKLKVGATFTSGFAVAIANGAASAASAGVLTPFVGISITAGSIMVTCAGWFKNPKDRKLRLR